MLSIAAVIALAGPGAVSFAGGFSEDFGQEEPTTSINQRETRDRLRSDDPAERLFALDQLLNATHLPRELWREVSLLTRKEQDETTRIRAIRVIPRFGSRQAGETLSDLLEDEAEPIRAEAAEALETLVEPGVNRTVGEWISWAERASEWSDRTWNARIIAGLSARARLLAETQADGVAESQRLYRRLHVELDAAGRTQLLGELIRDDRGELRDLGFELAGRDLSARTALGEEVALAAGEALIHQDARTRAQAGILLVRLAPPDAMLRVTQAIAVETDQAAAEPLLQGLTRWPNFEAVPSVLRWLAHPDAPRAAASAATWALVQEGLVSDAVDIAQILRSVRPWDDATLTESAMRLLVRLGNEDDLARVASMLEADDPSLVRAAASALPVRIEGTGVLLQAASLDARLFEFAARAIQDRPAPGSVQLLATLPCESKEQRVGALVNLARALPIAELGSSLGASHLDLDSETIELMLVHLEATDVARDLAWGRVMLHLAMVRLELGRAAEAHETLAAVPMDIDPQLSDDAQQLRRACVVLLAETPDSIPESETDSGRWYEALELLRDMGKLTLRGVALVRDRFAGDWPVNQADQIDAWLQELEVIESETANDD